jgi:hypothetical protein
MKKVALSLLAFAMAGALAFGQDAPTVKIGGYVNSGLMITNNSNGTTYQAYANDFGAAGYVGKLSATLAAHDYGFVIITDMEEGNKYVIDTMYAWASPMEGLKLFSGTGNDGSLNELDNNGANTFSSADFSAIYSADGLTLGAGVNPTSTVNSSAPVSFGGRYAADKLATVNLTGYTNGAAVDGLRITGSLTAVPDLVFTAGYNSTTMATSTASFIDVESNYNVTPQANLGAFLYYYFESGTYYAGTVQVEGEDTFMSSSAGVMKARLYGSYKLTDKVKLSAYFQGDTDSNPNYEPQAQVSYTMLPGAVINTQVFYDTNPNHLASAVSNTTFDIDFVYSF